MLLSQIRQTKVNSYINIFTNSNTGGCGGRTGSIGSRDGGSSGSADNDKQKLKKNSF
jgi:hypothetical protein